MLSLLGKTRIVDDPGLNRSLLFHRGQPVRPHLPHHSLVIPGRIRHQMMQRLMHLPNPVRRQSRGHRLHALPFTR
jgi:hypothetical protein